MMLAPNPLKPLSDEIFDALPMLIAEHPAGIPIPAIVRFLGADAQNVRMALKQLNVEGRADLMRKRSSREHFIVPLRYRHADGLRCCVRCGGAFELKAWGAPSKRGVTFSKSRTCSPSCAAFIGLRHKGGGRTISQQQRDHAINLRLEYQLSAPAIAKIVGIATHSAYRILKDYPWQPPDKRAATHGKDWTTSDDATLRAMYSSSERDEIVSRLPGRSWIAIERRASFLKIRRNRKEARNHGRCVHPILAELLSQRLNRGLAREHLSQSCGIAHGQILGWELGKTMPRLSDVSRWARALGFDLVLREANS